MVVKFSPKKRSKFQQSFFLLDNWIKKEITSNIDREHCNPKVERKQPEKNKGKECSFYLIVFLCFVFVEVMFPRRKLSDLVPQENEIADDFLNRRLMSDTIQ
jgi:hypothetical protein